MLFRSHFTKADLKARVWVHCSTGEMISRSIMREWGGETKEESCHMHVWMSSYSWGWELSSKPSLLPKPENGLIQRNTEIPKWCIGTSAGDLKSHRIKGYGGTLVRATTTLSSAMAPKAVWDCFSSSSRPSEPWRNPDLAGLGHTPTMDQS